MHAHKFGVRERGQVALMEEERAYITLTPGSRSVLQSLTCPVVTKAFNEVVEGF